MPTIDEYLLHHAARFEDELCQFLRIPSVSADPTCGDAMQRAAEWVEDQLRLLGLATEVIPTAGPPLVYAESPTVPGAPTALVYGHYDVQPPDPVDRWTSPPFEPTQRDGNLYGRGATDDKGQMLTHIKSVEAWRRVHGELPLQLKFLFEGEEEVGSAALSRYLADHADRLACDCVVISDSAQFGPDRPAITYGLRGIAFYDIRLTGPARDLHSGSFGGTVTNPANTLAQLLGALLDRQGKVQVPGFYDDVVPLSDAEREQLAALEFDEAAYFAQLGVDGAVGESGYTLLERRWARPTFDICRLSSGAQGDWAKTIIPATATAKISFRLVPRQDPAKITAALRKMLAELCPPGIQIEVIDLHGSPGVLVPLDSPWMAAAARAIEHAFGHPPVYTREGGSIPIVTAFSETLGADTLLLGWGQEDDNAHSPNEKLSLRDFHRGIKASARLWEELAAVRKQ